MENQPQDEAPKSEETPLITSADIPWSAENPQPDTEPLPVIEVPDDLGIEAARRVVSEPSNEGRSGLGVIEVPMPADPSKVPGWNGQVRR